MEIQVLYFQRRFEGLYELLQQSALLWLEFEAKSYEFFEFWSNQLYTYISAEKVFNLIFWDLAEMSFLFYYHNPFIWGNFCCNL